MAPRTKTIEYCFDQRITALASNVRHDFSAITIYVPEPSATFRSVYMELTFKDNANAATAVTAWLLGIKLGATAFDDATVTDTITHSSEHWTGIFTRDVTGYFNTNFGGGTSQTCQAGIRITGPSTMNHCVRLYITYTYDDSSATTRIRTVRIPLDSPTGLLTNVLTEIGTNQVPNLDTFLPEASKVYRDIFFEVSSQNGSVATTTFALALALDSEAESQDGLAAQGLTSSVWYRRLWKRTDMATNAAHAFKARSTVTNRFNTLTVVLVVTYEYDHSSSTSVMNSIVIPFEFTGPLPYDDSTVAARFRRLISVQEPGTILHAQSGVLLSFNASADIASIELKIGEGGSYRSYTHQAGTVTSGQVTLMQRFDIDSEVAGGINYPDGLIRGMNDFIIDVYSTDTTDLATNVSGLVYLNYTSDKHADGDGVHSHTTFWQMADTAADSTTRTISNFSPVVEETNWYNVATGFLVPFMVTSASMFILIQASVGSGEGNGAGWADLYSDNYLSDNELGLSIVCIRARDQFERWADDPDTSRLGLISARDYKIYSTTSMWTGMQMILTHHAISHTVSGTVTNYTGFGGSGIPVALHNASTRETVDTGTTSFGGTYSLITYDDTVTHFVTARQDSTHCGRSDSDLP